MKIRFTSMEMGDKRSRFQKIFEENHILMYRIALGILHNETDAEEAVQEAFCKLLENFSKYFHLSGREMTSLCVTIVKRKAIDILRQQEHLSDQQVENLVLFEEDRENLPEEAAVLREEQNAVQRALTQIPEIYREALYLKFYCGMKVSEIAKLLDVSPKTVEMRLYRGQKMLKGIMKNEE